VRHILEPPELSLLDQFARSAVIVKARIKTRRSKQWLVGRAFNRRMKRFDELGDRDTVSAPDIYLGADKSGETPPFRVRVDAESRAEQPPRSDAPSRPTPLQTPERVPTDLPDVTGE
jgi:moderate conductance mechanosensitive channel